MVGGGEVGEMGGVGERSHSILDYISDIKFQRFSVV